MICCFNNDALIYIPCTPKIVEIIHKMFINFFIILMLASATTVHLGIEFPSANYDRMENRTALFIHKRNKPSQSCCLLSSGLCNHEACGLLSFDVSFNLVCFASLCLLEKGFALQLR